MLRSFLITICALSFVLGLSQTAHACECSLDSNSVEDVFAGADVVFVGKVIKVTSVKKASVALVMYPNNQVWKKFAREMQSVTLEVAEAFKGVSGETIEVTTDVYSPGSCGVQFKEGESYLVYAHKRQPLLSDDEAKLPQETWTQEIRLKAEADKFNGSLLWLSTNICWRTERLHLREEEVGKIRQIIKSKPPLKEEQRQIRNPCE
jgi:hypothetical protein